MPNIHLDDVKDICKKAASRFADKNSGDFQYDLPSYAGTTIRNDRADNVMWNYNIPLMFQMDSQKIKDLEKWWGKKHPNSGQVLPSQWKHNHWIINVQYITNSRRLFNMHIAVWY